MKSKIDYHVLTMDEIVFDNRNKAYGAFLVRQHYERNLLKAIFISIGIFGLAMSSPAILRNLGLMAGTQTESFVEEIFKLEDFQGIRGTTIITKTEQPSTDTREKEVTPEKADKLPPEKPETTAATTTATGSSTSAGGNDIGTPAGTGAVITTVEVTKPKKPEVFDANSVDELPEFIGGQRAFEDFVQDNIIYPADEKIDEVEGTVKIQFIVTEDGAIHNIALFESSGHRNFDREALRLVKSLPKYKPGRHRGVAVKVFCVLPIHFIIE